MPIAEIAPIGERIDTPASLLRAQCWVPNDFMRFASMVYHGTKFTTPQAEEAFHMLLAYSSSDQTSFPEAMKFLMSKIATYGIPTYDESAVEMVEIRSFAKEYLKRMYPAPMNTNINDDFSDDETIPASP